MLETIVVLVDDLRGIQAAFAHAAMLAGPLSARVLVLGIINRIGQEVGEKFTDPVIWSMTRSEDEATLNQQVRFLEEQGIESHIEIIQTSKVDVVLQHAEAIHCDLMIVAVTDDPPSIMIRSLLKHSNIPIFLARAERDQSKYSRMLVPLDGSQRAESSLTLATTIAKSMNSELHLAHVVQHPEMPRRMTLSEEDTEIARRLVERNLDEAKRYLEQVASRSDVNVNMHVISNGTVTTTLHNLILQEDIDLLILSAHGYSGEPRWPLGTVAENLVSYAKVPTIIVQDLPAHLPKPQVVPTRAQSGTR